MFTREYGVGEDLEYYFQLDVLNQRLELRTIGAICSVSVYLFNAHEHMRVMTLISKYVVKQM